MAMHTAVGFSEKVDESYEAGLEIGEMVLEKIEIQAHAIGILFCHVDFDFDELLKGIGEKLDIPILGCTAAGEVNNDGYFEESASLMVITSDSIRVGLGIGEDLSKDPKAAVSAAYTSAQAMLGEDKPRLALTFPDSWQISTDRVLNLLESHLGKSVPMVGGLPGDNYQFKKTYQFCRDGIYSDSIPLLLLAGDIEPLVITRSGWIPMGTKARITKAEGNVLYEINHQPAIDYLKNYIPNIDDPDLMGSYPLALLDESLGAEAGKYCVIRGGFTYNKEDGSLVGSGDLPENTTIQLARGSREDILAGTDDAITTLKEKAANKKVHALLCFSCAARRLMLGLETKKEIELVMNKMPAECTLNGFYTYGEIGPIDSSLEHLRKSRYHNTTLVLCAF